MNTPVLFLVFRRPELTRRVFDAIKQARPAKLFVAADGPRSGTSGEYEQCQATRDAICGQIDWECQVQTLLRDKNLGCKLAVSSAIDWFFEHVEEGIILEDDCLPDLSFFGFCEALLDKYRDAPEVMHISGDNFQAGRSRGDGSYYGSSYAHIWGWATWRRAWKHYDVGMKCFPEFKRSGGLERIFDTEAERAYWLKNLERTYRGDVNTWDFQWTFSLWAHNGIAILPNANLVENIGFGAGGTHTVAANKWSPPLRASAGPLIHPSLLVRDRQTDEFTFSSGAISGERKVTHSLWKRLASRLKPERFLETSAGLAAARILLKRNANTRVFHALNRSKSRHTAKRNVDYLRALYFQRRGELSSAVESLKEELRYFPDHVEAAALLTKLQQSPQSVGELPDDPEFRELYPLVQPYTMLSASRLWNLFRLARNACQQDLEGNIVECGVAAGGSSALLATAIARHSRRPRRLFACDSFSGMPAPTAADAHKGLSAEATGWGAGTCAAPEASLLEVCRRLGVADFVEPVAGFFGETLPLNRDRIGSIALLHMDGDWYESTRDILVNLFDSVTAGGCVQIDDYGHWDGCRKAVSEFTESRGLTFNIQPIDYTGVWFEK